MYFFSFTLILNLYVVPNILWEHHFQQLHNIPVGTEMQPTIPVKGHLGGSKFLNIINPNNVKFLTFGYS